MLLVSSIRASFRGSPSIVRTSVLLTRSTPLTSPTKSQPLIPVRYSGGAGHTGWKIQKISAALTYITFPVGLIFPHPLLSYTLGITLPMYFYYCLHEIITDYTNKQPFLNFSLNTAAILLCTANFIALNYFNFSDVGITNALHGLLTL